MENATGRDSRATWWGQRSRRDGNPSLEDGRAEVSQNSQPLEPVGYVPGFLWPIESADSLQNTRRILRYLLTGSRGS